VSVANIKTDGHGQTGETNLDFSHPGESAWMFSTWETPSNGSSKFSN
jgi:hypothetical protein